MFPSVLDAIGCTPVVRLQRMAPAGISIYAKLESLNPAGSIKDRLALGVIEAAERSGALRPGQTVIEASSGNTGIGLAAVCAAKGYPLVVVMAENFSLERRRLMRFLGARVVLTPASLKGSGMLAKARELADAHGWYWCRQFENPANAEIHARTTAQEILSDFQDERLNWWITGAGTGGTLQGVASVLRRERPGCRIALCEPENAPMIASGLAQSRRPDGTPVESHPEFRPHPMQGWSPDFIPLLAEQSRERGHVDRLLPIAGADALAFARELARREGILTGISGGATIAGALQLAHQCESGSALLCLLPDSAERYQSTPLFADIGADMDDAEWALSRSTPGARFDRPLAPPLSERTRRESGDPTVEAELDLELDSCIDDPAHPALMFSLGWCEFCWSVQRLFERCGTPLRVLALDAPQMATQRRGLRLRTRLQLRTGCVTLPQVFVGGRFMGGCSEVFASFRDGSLALHLAASGLPFQPPADLVPESLLPRWLHARRAERAMDATP